MWALFLGLLALLFGGSPRTPGAERVTVRCTVYRTPEGIRYDVCLPR